MKTSLLTYLLPSVWVSLVKKYLIYYYTFLLKKNNIVSKEVSKEVQLVSLGQLGSQEAT